MDNKDEVRAQLFSNEHQKIERIKTNLESKRVVVDIDKRIGSSLDIYEPDKVLKKAAFLFIPGSGLNANSGLKLYDYFLQRGYRVVGINLRGVKKDYDGMGQAGFAEYLEDVNKGISEFKSSLNIEEEEVILVGHSLGGILALEVSKSRAFKGVVNFAGALTKDNLSKLHINDQQIDGIRKLSDEGRVFKRDARSSASIFEGESISGLERLHEDVLGQDPAKVTYEIYTEGIDCDESDYEKTKGLIIAAEKDSVVPIEANRQTAEKLGFAFESIDSSHMIPLSVNSDKAFKIVEDMISE